MSILSILTKARALLAQGWTQHHNARDKKGNPVPAWAPQATCYCLEGAIICVAEGESHSTLVFAERILRKQIDEEGFSPVYPSLATWNDDPERTQEEVLKLADRCIKEATHG